MIDETDKGSRQKIPAKRDQKPFHIGPVRPIEDMRALLVSEVFRRSSDRLDRPIEVHGRVMGFIAQWSVASTNLPKDQLLVDSKRVRVSHFSADTRPVLTEIIL